MPNKNILIVDDEKNFLELLKFRLETEGYNVTTKMDVKNAYRVAKDISFDLALIDLKLDGDDGIELMQNIHTITPDMPVIILTAHGTIENAVDAMQRGAYNYLTKPFDHRDLLLQIKNGLEKNDLSKEVKRLKALLGERCGFQNIIGKSKKIINVLETCARASEIDSNVCIYGESGTGKELIAKSIHLLSSRKDKPFVAINCAAIPEGIFEGELFGFKKGAFTGAINNKNGYFMQAHGGTIFLDEISEIPESMQAKLLRVIQEKQFYPLGGEKSIKVDVRILSATNQNLEKKIQKGNFREDLFYRIHVIPIHIPPLRDRKEDIPLLVDYFIKKISKKMDKNVQNISPGALQKILTYSWPGNIRELRNVIEYAIAMTDNKIISKNLILQTKQITANKFKPFKEAKNKFEKDYISHLLLQTKGDVTQAAKLAQKYRADIYDLLKKHDINLACYKPSTKL